jgi:hypothetical protein
VNAAGRRTLGDSWSQKKLVVGRHIEIGDEGMMDPNKAGKDAGEGNPLIEGATEIQKQKEDERVIVVDVNSKKAVYIVAGHINDEREGVQYKDLASQGGGAYHSYLELDSFENVVVARHINDEGN